MTKFKLVSVLPALCASWMLTGCPDDSTEGNDDNNNDSSSDESNSDPDTTVSGVTLSTTDDPSSSSDDTIDPTMTTVDPDSSSSGDPTDATESSSSSADGSSDSGSDSGSSSGSDSGSSTDPSAGTSSESGVVPMDGYGDCINNPEEEVCVDGEDCLNVGAGTGVCGLLDCADDGDCSAPGSGDATPVCLGLMNGGTACALDCSMGQTCPNGMVCAMEFACVWEQEPLEGGECPDDEIGAAPTSYDGDNTGLGEDHVPSCAGNGGGEDELLEFTADEEGIYTFDTIGATADTALFALDACGGEEFACNDDIDAANENYQSILGVFLTAGQTVIIGVDSYGGETGPYTLNVAYDAGVDGGSCCDEAKDGGCDVAEVQDCVCALDDFCCDTAWDGACVGLATNQCLALCG